MLLLAASFDCGPEDEKDIFSYSKEVTFQQYLVVVDLGNRNLADLEVTRLWTRGKPIPDVAQNMRHTLW